MLGPYTEAVGGGAVKGERMTSWMTRLEMVLVSVLVVVLTALATSTPGKR
jgi:hypothetical protein